MPHTKQATTHPKATYAIIMTGLVRARCPVEPAAEIIARDPVRRRQHRPRTSTSDAPYPDRSEAGLSCRLVTRQSASGLFVPKPPQVLSRPRSPSRALAAGSRARSAHPHIWPRGRSDQTEPARVAGGSVDVPTRRARSVPRCLLTGACFPRPGDHTTGFSACDEDGRE